MKRIIAFSLDELIVLNASKDKKNIQEFGNDVFIPIAAGGGIRTVEFENGADKLVINTILYENPDLVKIYGSQSLDYKIFINDGKEEIEFTLEYVQSLGVGEKDLETISDIVKIPLIIAGNEKHLIDGLSLESVSAVATANFIGNARKKIVEQNLLIKEIL